jgi:hypothetical protein
MLIDFALNDLKLTQAVSNLEHITRHRLDDQPTGPMSPADPDQAERGGRR